MKNIIIGIIVGLACAAGSAFAGYYVTVKGYNGTSGALVEHATMLDGTVCYVATNNGYGLAMSCKTAKELRPN